MKEKGLTKTDEFNEKYLYLQALYRANLESYLLEVLDLQETDEFLKSSELEFVTKKEEEKDVYERYSTMDLTFIYLRNNLHIEYLTKEEIALLEKHLMEGKEVIDEEVKEMVKETYPIIIKVRSPWYDYQEDLEFRASYSQGEEPDIPNTALVIAIDNCFRYDENDNVYPKDNFVGKMECVKKIKLEKEKKYSEILNIPVYIREES